MAKRTETFNDIVAQLDAGEGLNSLLISLRVTGTRPCPSPPWDPQTAHRVKLVDDKPQIQKHLASGDWVVAPLHPPPSIPEYGHLLQTTEVRIFISHSSEDVDLARALIGVLDAAITIPDRTLRCTSVPGYKLEAGDDPADVLRRNLQSCAVVVGLLTPTSLASRYVLLELGAAWAFGRRVCSLLAPGIPFTDLPGPFSRVHALKMTDQTDIADLLDTIARHTGFSRRVNSAKTQDALGGFVALASHATSAKPAAVDPAVADLEPITSSQQEAVLRLKHWANEERRTGRVNLAKLEAELRLADGLAQRCLVAAVGTSHKVEFGEGSAYLEEKPMGIVDVRGSQGILRGGFGDY